MVEVSQEDSVLPFQQNLTISLKRKTQYKWLDSMVRKLNIFSKRSLVDVSMSVTPVESHSSVIVQSAASVARVTIYTW